MLQGVRYLDISGALKSAKGRGASNPRAKANGKAGKIQWHILLDFGTGRAKLTLSRGCNRQSVNGICNNN
jgi:hypothetical protein